MRPGRIVALVIGCIVALPALGLVVGGGALTIAYATQRDDDGYFDTTIDRLVTTTVAITAEDIDLDADTGDVDRVLDALDVDVRLRVTSAAGNVPVFVGIGPETEVDRYLGAAAHDEIVDLDGRAPRYRTRAGGVELAPPTDQSFWAASASGLGTQQLDWEATSGQWAVVVMNADGRPGVSVDVNVGAKAGFVLTLALILLGIGAVLGVGAVVLIVVGATGSRSDWAPVPAAPGTESADVMTGRRSELGGVAPIEAASPVTVEARLDLPLSRWRWLVKWFLAIPHVVVLLLLWMAFVVLTAVAWFAVVFTGRYPRSIFEFNVGVLRWSWRVSFYAWDGGLGTDRYPPFSLAPEPGYPASLDVAYPEHLSRGLALVKWWLLALPQYLVIAILIGVGNWGSDGWMRLGFGGLLGLLTAIAAMSLLFTGRYPPRLFDLIVGLNRWVYRVVAYAALMTDRYPPFHLDQGGSEPPPSAPDEPEVASSGP
jgi:Domain of unknown function (DUF4389)